MPSKRMRLIASLLFLSVCILELRKSPDVKFRYLELAFHFRYMQ